jgi:hypothetical protein
LPAARIALANAGTFHAMDTGDTNVVEQALRDVSAAQAWSKNSLAVLVTSSRAHTLASILYRRLGDHTRAEAEVRAADAAGQRLEMFHPSLLALRERVVQLSECGFREQALLRLRTSAEEVPRLRALYITILWQTGDSKGALESFRRWRDFLIQRDEYTAITAFLATIELPEEDAERGRLFDTVRGLRDEGSLSLFAGYLAHCLRGDLAEARKLARDFAIRQREKIAALGPHYQRLLQYAPGGPPSVSYPRFRTRSGCPFLWFPGPVLK